MFVVGDDVVWPPLGGVTARRTTLVSVSRAPETQDEAVRSVCSRTAPTKADSVVLAKEVENQLGGLATEGRSTVCGAVPAKILKTAESSKETAPTVSFRRALSFPARTVTVVAAIPAAIVPVSTTVPAFGGHEVKVTQNVEPMLQLKQGQKATSHQAEE